MKPYGRKCKDTATSTCNARDHRKVRNRLKRIGRKVARRGAKVKP